MPERCYSGSRGTEIQLSEDEGVIIHSIFVHGPQSRTEFAQKTCFSRSKITDKITGLLRRNILREIDRPGGDHTKWKNLAINQSLGYLVGIDIGTTSVDIALADCSCKLIEHKSAMTHVNDGPEQVLQECVNLLNDILRQHDIPQEEIIGIGVGVPGPVSYPSGKVIGGQFTPGWEGYRIQEILSKEFSEATIKTDNDANLMAMGSHKEGLAQGIDNFIFVKIGTGIGSGLYCHGHLYRGATSCAGHIGHTCVDIDGPICRCGNRGCLEALVGGPAISAAAETAVFEGKSESLARLKDENNGSLSAVQVGEAVVMHDQAAQQIIVNSATLIGSVLAGVVNLYNPELIILGGGISKIGNLFLAEIRREVLKRTYSYTTMGLRIEFSQIIDSVGVVGATHFIRDWVFTVGGNRLSFLA